MPQEKKWWPEDVKAYLQDMFGNGAVVSVPMSFSMGRDKSMVRLVCPSTAIAKGLFTLAEAEHKRDAGAAPEMRYDAGKRLELYFAKDAYFRGQQLTALKDLYGRLISEQVEGASPEDVRALMEKHFGAGNILVVPEVFDGRSSRTVVKHPEGGIPPSLERMINTLGGKSGVIFAISNPKESTLCVNFSSDALVRKEQMDKLDAFLDEHASSILAGHDVEHTQHEIAARAESKMSSPELAISEEEPRPAVAKTEPAVSAAPVEHASSEPLSAQGPGWRDRIKGALGLGRGGRQ